MKVARLITACAGCVIAALLWTSCSDKSNGPADRSGVIGTWQDTTAGVTFYFDDTTWWSGINGGSYDATDDTHGTLDLLDSWKFATYELRNGMMYVTIQVDNTEYALQRVSSELPVNLYRSDLTRRGIFMAFTTDRCLSAADHDTEGNIYIYTVDSSARLDTVFYYDTAVTVVNSHADTVLVRKYVEPVRALTDRAGLDAMPSWSPDGKRLAYVSDSGGVQAIWIYYLDQFASPLLAPVSDSVPTNPIRLTNPVQGMEDANPSWSPDGQRIVFERRDIVNSPDHLRNLFIIDATDFGETVAATNFSASPGNDCFNPEWSPRSDVNVILFERNQNGTSSDWDVFWMSADDTRGFDSCQSQKVTNPNRNGHPTWSPDCRSVAYERNPPGSDDQYDVMIQGFSASTDTAATVDRVYLTDQSELSGLNRYPTWLPNGNLIAFMRQPTLDVSSDVWLIDLSAGIDSPTYRQLLDDGYRHWDIAW